MGLIAPPTYQPTYRSYPGAKPSQTDKRNIGSQRPDQVLNQKRPKVALFKIGSDTWKSPAAEVGGVRSRRSKGKGARELEWEWRDDLAD